MFSETGFNQQGGLVCLWSPFTCHLGVRHENTRQMQSGSGQHTDKTQSMNQNAKHVGGISGVNGVSNCVINVLQLINSLTNIGVNALARNLQRQTRFAKQRARLYKTGYLYNM